MNRYLVPALYFRSTDEAVFSPDTGEPWTST
jgi:hypothetical protein